MKAVKEVAIYLAVIAGLAALAYAIIAVTVAPGS